MPEKIIDTHIHVWNFARAKYSWLNNDTSILNRNYHIEELEGERQKVNVTEGVLVQAANNFEETAWMLEVARNTGWISAVVGWLPLTDPHATARALEETYLSERYFTGVRHLIHDEADPKWLLQDTVIESLKILAQNNITYDFVGVLTDHIKTALEIARLVPGLKMVFDHLNQPPIASGEKYGLWGQLMKEAAAHPNFYAKISGHGNTSKKQDWAVDDIKPYVEFAFTHFGEDRCFCGSNWPVSLLAGSYARTMNIYRECISSLLNEQGREKVYYSNAKSFYKIQ